MSRLFVDASKFMGDHFNKNTLPRNLKIFNKYVPRNVVFFIYFDDKCSFYFSVKIRVCFNRKGGAESGSRFAPPVVFKPTEFWSSGGFPGPGF